MTLSTKPTRRSKPAAIPAVAATVAPATATALVAPTGDDPIFAAIEAFKQADDASFRSHKHWPAGPNAWREAHREIVDAYDAARTQLAQTVPTTIAGAAALLAFYVEDDPWDSGDRDWHEPAIRNLANALTRLATCR